MIKTFKTWLLKKLIENTKFTEMITTAFDTLIHKLAHEGYIDVNEFFVCEAKIDKSIKNDIELKITVKPWSRVMVEDLLNSKHIKVRER